MSMDLSELKLLSTRVLNMYIVFFVPLVLTNPHCSSAISGLIYSSNFVTLNSTQFLKHQITATVASRQYLTQETDVTFYCSEFLWEWGSQFHTFVWCYLFDWIIEV